MVGRLREGRYVIPDFQRDFEWEPWDIKELMSSIFRDYYIGSLLLWNGKEENFEALSCEAIYGFEGGDGRTDIVLDGQQRLTAMYYAFMAPNKPAAAQDYREIKTWYVDDNAEPGSISEFQRDIDNLDLRRETRRGTSVYNGVFNLLVLNGARDWISGNAPQHGDLDDHHIVPKSLGSQYALSTSIDTILNRTPLTSETNRKVIRDRLPNEYLPELIATNGKDEVMRILESHFISARAFDILMKNPFTPGDFEKFIEEWGNTLRSRIKDLAGQVGL